MGRACAEEVTRWTATAIGLANGEARRLAGSRQPSTKRVPAERDPKGNRAPTFTRRYEFSATLITLTFRIATRKKRWLAPTRGRCQPPVAVAAICYCCDVVGRRAPARPASRSFQFRIVLKPRKYVPCVCHRQKGRMANMTTWP